MSLESLPTVLSNSHAFHCFIAAGFVILLFSVSQLDYMKFSSPSNITANLVAVFHFCIWLFWTKSLGLNLNRILSFILLCVNLITLNKTLLDIFPIFWYCVWAVLHALWALLHKLPIVSFDCDYFSWYLFSTWLEWHIFFRSPSAPHCAPIVACVSEAVNIAGFVASCQLVSK